MSEPKSVALFSSSLVCAIFVFLSFFGFLVSWFLVFFTSWLPSFALPPSFFWQIKKPKKKTHNVRAQVRGSLLIFLGVCNLVFLVFLFFLVSWFLVFFTSWLPSFALPPSFFWQTKKQKKQNVRAQVRGSLLIFLGLCNLVFLVFLFFLVSCVLHIMAAFLRAASKLLLTNQKAKKTKTKNKKTQCQSPSQWLSSHFPWCVQSCYFCFLVVLFFGFLVSCVLHIMAAFLRAAS